MASKTRFVVVVVVVAVVVVGGGGGGGGGGGFLSCFRLIGIVHINSFTINFDIAVQST